MDLAREVEHWLLVKRGDDFFTVSHGDCHHQVGYGMRQLAEPYATKVDRPPTHNNIYWGPKPNYGPPNSHGLSTFNNNYRPLTSQPPKAYTHPLPTQMSGVNQRNPNFTCRQRGTQSLSDWDFQDLRNKGLCFRCKQPYHPLHVCQKKTL